MSSSEALVPSDSALPRPSRGSRFWRHPLTQLVFRILAFSLFAGLLSYAMRWLIPLPSLKGPTEELAQSPASAALRLLRSVIAIGGAYWLLARLVERRRVLELAPRKAPPHVATGWLVGAGIMLAAAAAMAAVGAFSVHGVHQDAPLLVPLLVLGIAPGITEEIVARGILFRVVEEATGTWFALAFSAILFGAGHFANPNATWWSSLAIAVEAGGLLGMAYAWTRSLWFVMALHAAWNFTQGPLLGIPVSGIGITGLLDSSTQGLPILSGGEFGAEASILAVLICVPLALYFTRRAQRLGRVAPPFWRRRLADGSVPALAFEEPANA